MLTKNVIFFDCMETLIDMHEIPGEREYALWAFEGSGVEGYWEGFREYFEDFRAVQRMLKESLPYDKEYDIKYRIGLVAQKKIGREKEKVTEEIVARLVSNFWSKYKEKCYVSKEVAETLSFLAQKGYKMGVVSNFLFKGGVQEILNLHGLAKHFQFVVTSVDEGWRKPHPYLYEVALAKVGIEAEKAIFIGDDYLNDYITPQKIGFTTLFFDRGAGYPEVDKRFMNFKELRNYF